MGEREEVLWEAGWSRERETVVGMCWVRREPVFNSEIAEKPDFPYYLKLIK